jgi:hypothetical protein
MMRPLNGFLLLVCLAAPGCSMTSFDVVVNNRTPDPITVWITKDHGPYEEGWAPPEIVAVGGGENGPLGGHVVQPGQSGEARVKARIDSNNVAILRIYGATDIDGILSISRGSPDRVDMPLDPGRSDLDAVRIDGQLTTVPHGRSPNTAH